MPGELLFRALSADAFREAFSRERVNEVVDATAGDGVQGGRCEVGEIMGQGWRIQHRPCHMLEARDSVEASTPLADFHLQ